MGGCCSDLELQRKLEVHNSRTRRVRGCLHCGKVLKPLDQIYVCNCHRDPITACPEHVDVYSSSHEMFCETIYFEVDTGHMEGLLSISEALESSFSTYAERPCLGHREDRDFIWKSYAEVANDVKCFVQACSSQGIEENDTIVLFAAPSVEWYISQYACWYGGFIVVPMHHTKSNLAQVIDQCEAKLVVISAHLIHLLPEDSNCSIVILEDSEDWYGCRKANSAVVSGVAFEDFLQKGSSGSAVQKGSGSGSAVCQLLPTSGSSGVCKLVIFTVEMLMAQWNPPKLAVETIMLSHQPLRQSLDILAKGGRIGIGSGGLDKIMEDIQILRPTVFGSTPLFFEGLYRDFQLELSTCDLMDVELLAQYPDRCILGNRLSLIIIGGAVVQDFLREWIFKAFGVMVLNGYGTTETGGLASSGTISGGADLVLIDCPELGFFTSDEPFPRGEILASTKRLTPGYFNNKDATEENFEIRDGKRYFKTGDIGLLKNGNITIIDRKKFVVKLANGVFVSPSFLENIYKQCHLVQQIFVHASSSMVAVGCVVVLDDRMIDKEKDIHDFERELRAEFVNIAKSNKLENFEIPQQIYFTADEWSVDNGLITTIGKPCRPKLKLQYQSLFSDDNLDGLKLSAASKEVIETDLRQGFARLLLVLIPSLSHAPQKDDTLSSLGVDSLTLARISNSLKQKFGVQLSSKQLLQMSTMSNIETAVFSGGKIIQKVEIDWNQEVQREVDLLLEVFADTTGKREPSNSVLLTGATGFVGAFLLKECCRIFSKVFCLVRAQDSIHAMSRLEDNLSFYDLPIPQNFEAVVGDLSLPLFGMDEKNYHQLQLSVTKVIHNAAWVHSSKTYSELFEANVKGTSRILQFCQSYKIELHHISSIGVLSGTPVREEKREVPWIGAQNLSGYAQTKLVSEKIVLQIFQQGFLNGSIYRLGSISGSTFSGACNTSDTISKFVLGLLDLGCSCTGDASPLPNLFSLAPVDWTAKSVLQLVSSETFGIFHLINPNFTTLSSLTSFLSLPVLAKHEFLEKIREIQPKHPMFVWKDILLGSGFSRVDTSSYPVMEKTLEQLDQGPPEIDKNFISKMVLFLQSKN